MIARTTQKASESVVSSDQAIQHKFEHLDLLWIDMIQPGTDQLGYLREHYDFHPLHLEDVVSRLQRPKIDDNPDSEYLFLVLHFPVFDKTNRLSLATEVDIFAGRNYMITLHDGRYKPLARLVKSASDERVRSQLMGRGSGYLLYRIIEVLVNACFPMLYRVDQNLDRIEVGVFQRNAQAMVQELSFVRRDIISMRRIIKPNISVVRSLELRERTFLHVDEEVYFGDLTDALNKLWDMLEEQKEISEGLNATLDSLTSHRINEEMKIFTMISVLMLPMTLVASILGMNVPLPFVDNPLSLPVILVLMVALGLGMFIYFRYKNWV
ncbi:MAG: magnesium transporter CorA family protein [Chloroflexaceae bacterium]|nr:magnesium transporter CorA family protein [Chloroflexaceae bacterium]